MEIVRCKRCNAILRSAESIKRGRGKTCYRIHILQEANKTKNFDMKEVKLFITSEIQRIFKEFNFNRAPSLNIEVGVDRMGAVITDKKMPKFDSFEINKRLMIKDLKSSLEKGINNILQKIGSFDEEISFLEAPIEASA